MRSDALLAFVVLLAVGAPGQTFAVTPSPVVINGAADSTVMPAPVTFQLTAPSPNTPFAFGTSYIVYPNSVPNPPLVYEGILPGDLVIAPSSGVTPAAISLTLTTDLVRQLYPGETDIVLNLYSFQVHVTVKLTAPLPPVVAAVLNGASFQTTVSAGSLVSIFGEHIGPLPTNGTIGTLGATTSSPAYSAYLGPILGTLVNVGDYNNIPLFYADTGQINAVLPAELAGQQSVTVVVNHDGVFSPPFTVILSDAAPAIFTVTQNGAGQGAILNQDGSANSASNPAAAGTVVQIFGNGAGVWSPVLPDGVLVPLAPPYPAPVAKVSITIGGLPAQVEYAGAAPGLVSGMLQVNAVIPAGLAAGNQAVVLTVGRNSNSAQSVTVAVQ